MVRLLHGRHLPAFDLSQGRRIKTALTVAAAIEASISTLLGLSPQMIAKALESPKASGVDLSAWPAYASAAKTAAPEAPDQVINLD